MRKIKKLHLHKETLADLESAGSRVAAGAPTQVSCLTYAPCFCPDTRCTVCTAAC